MKVIFLDVDGVLNNPQSLQGDNLPDPDCIAVLNWLVDESGARLVISSAWRGRPDLAQVFQKWGVEAPIFDRTPYLEKDWYPSSDKTSRAYRGLEIQQWLTQTPYRVGAFVILDDDGDMGPFMSHLVQTDYHFGLTCADGCEALQVLNR